MDDQQRPEDKSFLRGQKFAGEGHPGTTRVERNPTFSKLMLELIELHARKSHDYAQDSNVYSNFEIAAEIAGISVYQEFLALIGVKISRLHEVLLKSKNPKNESILDTLKDMTTYCAIMTSYYIDNKDREGPKKP